MGEGGLFYEWLFYLGIFTWVGFKGNNWRRDHLVKLGFTLAGQSPQKDDAGGRPTSYGA